MSDGAVGVFEVESLALALGAADLALKAAPVSLAGTSYVLPGVIAVAVRGSVDAVVAAVDAVRVGLGPRGLRSSVVIGRPDAAVGTVLRERSTTIGRRAGAPSVPGRGRGRTAASAAPGRIPVPEVPPPAPTERERRRGARGVDPGAPPPGGPAPGRAG